MVNDQVFITSKLKPPGHKHAPKNAAPALWKLASENCPNVRKRLEVQYTWHSNTY